MPDGLFQSFAQSYNVFSNIKNNRRNVKLAEAEAAKETADEEALRVKNAAIMSKLLSIQANQKPNKPGVEGIQDFASIPGMTPEELGDVADLAGKLYQDAAISSPEIVRVQIGDRLVPHTYNSETGAYEVITLASGKEPGGPKFSPSTRTTAAAKSQDLAKTRLNMLEKARTANIKSIFDTVKLYLISEDAAKINEAILGNDSELISMFAESIVRSGMPQEAKAAAMKRIEDVNKAFIPLINAQVSVIVGEKEEEKTPTDEPKSKEENKPNDEEGQVVNDLYIAADGKSYVIENGVVTIDGLKYKVIK